MLRNPFDRGNQKSAITINSKPRMRPALSPSVSSSGPTPTDAIINPSAWLKAIVPFCVGVRWKRSDRSGKMVPSIAAIIP